MLSPLLDYKRLESKIGVCFYVLQTCTIIWWRKAGGYEYWIQDSEGLGPIAREMLLFPGQCDLGNAPWASVFLICEVKKQD